MNKLKLLQMYYHNYYDYYTSAKWRGGMTKSMHTNKTLSLSISLVETEVINIH